MVNKQIEEILRKAVRLEGHCVNEMISIPSSETHQGKGSFGQYVESEYFGIPNNSRPEPDFWPIPLELKAAPLKFSGKENRLVPKERIVLGIINFHEIVNETFESSHFNFKNNAILIIWYIYDKLKSADEFKVDLADIWECIEEDGPTIESDWNLICNKVKAGHAEDISEGDTLYLGACTKGATAETSFRSQPFSDVPAKQRAFCFKMSYVNHIYETLKSRRSNESAQPRIVTEVETSLERTVLNLFSPYMGMAPSQIGDALDYHPSGKAILALYARAILGFSRSNPSFYEFDAANIQVKTIRIEENGRIKEDMSFRNINFIDIVDQEWEDSDLYQELVSKFIFVVFRKTREDGEYRLSDVKFWNMPEPDLDIVKTVWERTRQLSIEGEYDSLPRKSENPIIHVRTKGKDSSDLTLTSTGDYITKRCFFLNNYYIGKQIVKSL